VLSRRSMWPSMFYIFCSSFSFSGRSLRISELTRIHFKYFRGKNESKLWWWSVRLQRGRLHPWPAPARVMINSRSLTVILFSSGPDFLLVRSHDRSYFWRSRKVQLFERKRVSMDSTDNGSSSWERNMDLNILIDWYSKFCAQLKVYWEPHVR
jgi:hypothetical protein